MRTFQRFMSPKNRASVGHLTAVLAFVATLAPATASPQAAQGTPAAAQSPTPEGYVPRGTRPGKGLAPGLKVTDLGKSARTYRVNMTKGDDILSGLTEFAEKYHIKNGHFTALGAINKGLFGWTDVERGIGQKKIELNQESEIVSLLGSITTDAEGRATVHGGHWFEAHVSIIAQAFVTEEEGASPGTK